MSMSLTQAGTNLTGNDALAQSIALYFRTPKGSIPLRPELGFAIFDYVDRNIGSVLKLIREVRTGLTLWDNRYTVLKAVPTYSEGKLMMLVTWRPAATTNNIINSLFPVQTS